MEKRKIELKPGDICPTCGQKIRTYTTSAKRKEASQRAGKLGGRPIDPNSQRQIALRKKAEKQN